MIKETADPKTDHENVVQIIIDDYRAKEKIQHRKANYFLIGIIVCMIVCLVIFLSANIITQNRDSRYETLNADKLRLEIIIYSDSLNSANRFRDSINTAEASLRNTIHSTRALVNFYSDPSNIYYPAGGSIRNDSDIFDRTLYPPKKKLSKKNVDSLKSDFVIQAKTQIIELKSDSANLLQIKKSQDSLAKSIRQKDSTIGGKSTLLALKKPSEDLYEFIETISTRVGAILILIFMTQLFSRMYRYNLKLADFYCARANAIELVYYKQSSPFDKIAQLLTPDNIDISQPRSPTRQATDLIKSLAELVNKSSK